MGKCIYLVWLLFEHVAQLTGCDVAELTCQAMEPEITGTV